MLFRHGSQVRKYHQYSADKELVLGLIFPKYFPGEPRKYLRIKVPLVCPLLCLFSEDNVRHGI